jgi:hypothetical protein
MATLKVVNQSQLASGSLTEAHFHAQLIHLNLRATIVLSVAPQNS